MNYLPQVAAAFAPAVNQMSSVASGNVAGKVAGAGLNTGNVYDTLNKAGVRLDPGQEAALQNHYAREAAQDSANQLQQGQAFSAGLLNTGANLSTERQMALNAQANAAQNVANQLQQLGNARRDNANAIAQAMGSVGNSGVFR